MEVEEEVKSSGEHSRRSQRLRSSDQPMEISIEEYDGRLVLDE